MQATGLGARFREMRSKLGFERQGDLADRLDRSRNSISAYERDQAVPDGETLLRLAALGVSIQWLLTGEGEMLQTDPAHGDGGEKPAETQGSRATDPDLMGRIIDTIRSVYKGEGQAIPDRTLGELAARWYDDIAAASDDPGDRADAVAERQIALRRDLRAAAGNPAASKRQA